MLSEFARVFERKVWRVQVAHLQRVHLQVRKDFFRYLWYCGKKQSECGLAWHWCNSTDLGLTDMFLSNLNAEIIAWFRKSRHKPNLESISKYGISPDLDEKKWLRSEHVHASYPGLSFRPPGFSPYKGRKKGEFRDWTNPVADLGEGPGGPGPPPLFWVKIEEMTEGKMADRARKSRPAPPPPPTPLAQALDPPL